MNIISTIIIKSWSCCCTGNKLFFNFSFFDFLIESFIFGAMKHNTICYNYTYTHKSKTSSNSHHQRYYVKLTGCSWHIYNKSETISFVQCSVFSAINSESISKSKIKSSSCFSFFGIKSSEFKSWKALFCKIKITIPNNFDYYYSTLLTKKKLFKKKIYSITL